MHAMRILAALALVAALAQTAWAKTCPPFFLRAQDGAVINPVTGENADKPVSTRQTCGAQGCHDYAAITKGYHFQQGWDQIKDDFNPQKPWMLSPGMMGKL
uniref:Cytochrome C n=1 Tax=Fundidesulfovibrio putealis TaxID=270496 RepID=A0A7C4AIB9_9BACT